MSFILQNYVTFSSSFVSLFLFLSPSVLLIFNRTSGIEVFDSVDTTEEELPTEILTVVSVDISFDSLFIIFVVVVDLEVVVVVGFVV